MNELLREMLFLPSQSSTVARHIDMLHYTVIGITTIGAAVVAAIGLVFLVRFRRRDHHVPLTPHVVVPTWLEATLIVGLLGLFCAWWVIGFLQYRGLQSVPRDAMPIYVTAKQWMWEFAYPDGPSSANVLTVPVGRPVKLIMTSRDVIHSFYVPAFRIKQDVVPGHALTAWFEATEQGVYDVLCAEYCGTRHSMMRAQVAVLSGEDYTRWLEAARGPLALPGAKGEGQGLAARGQVVAASRGCLRCHSVDGSQFIGPTWANLFGRMQRLSDGSSVLADEEYLTQSMMDPRAKIVAGYQPVMPSYQGLLTPEETSALLEYIRSLADVHPETTVPPPEARTFSLPGSTP
jgi:cytochrome c oxidase subunit 2